MNQDRAIPKNVLLAREVSLFKKNSESDLFVSKNESGELVFSQGFGKVLMLTAQIKQQVIEYQKAHNISAISWLETEWEGKIYRHPHPLHHLECLPQDRELLDIWKMKIVAQYLEWVAQNEASVTYTSPPADDEPILITAEEIRQAAEKYEMANLIVWSDLDTDGTPLESSGTFGLVLEQLEESEAEYLPPMFMSAIPCGPF